MATKPQGYGGVVNSHINSQFKVDPATTSGLTFGYQSGQFSRGYDTVEVPPGTLLLPDNSTSYIHVTNAGTVGIGEQRNMLYVVTTAGGQITDINDVRSAPL